MASGSLSSLQLRILSAAVMLPLAVGIIWYGGLAFQVLVLIGCGLMAFEWLRMVDIRRESWRTGIAIGLVVAGVSQVSDGRIEAAFVLLGVAALLVAVLFRQRPLWSFAGMLYVGIPSIILIWLRDLPDGGLLLVFWTLVVVWSTDIGAYVAGRSIGGPKLIPSISPNKTWAGLGGGMVSAAIAGGLMAQFDPQLPALPLAVFGALVAVVAQAGDFAESAVKRHFNVKDSGALIPGHGGVLDRLDGVLSAAPFVAGCYLMWGGRLWL
jgi:phosphatidate cytidylyltransferase